MIEWPNPFALADPEPIGGVLAALREEYPSREVFPLSLLAEQIDWPTVRYFGETITAYRERAELVRRSRYDGP